MSRRDKIEKIHRRTVSPWEIRNPASKGEEYSMYPHIFPEDVETHILPYRIREDKYFHITVENDSTHDDLDLLLSVANEEDHYPVEQSLEALIRRVGMLLAFEGQLYYEIATITKKQDPGGSHILAPLLIPGKVVRLGKLYAQFALDQENKPRVILINSSKVWHIELPKELGGRRKQKTMRNKLASASKLIPDYLNSLQINWLEDKNYNAKEFHDIQTNLLASSTQTWGWPARNMWREKVLDYFIVYREIRFAHSLAILRKHIVTSFQEFLYRVNIPCKIDITGLMEAEDFIKLSNDLQAGNISFENALKIIR